MEFEGLAEGDRGLPGKTDDAETVGPVGGDLKFHHVVVHTDDRLDVVAGSAVLAHDEDTVGDAVGELPLLRVEVRQRADVLRFRVQSQSVVLVNIGKAGCDGVVSPAAVAADGKLSIAKGFHLCDKSGPDRAIDFMAGNDARGDGGLFRVNGMIVVQQRGGGDGGVGEVPLVQAQLAEAAHHAVRQYAPQLATGNFFAAGKGGVVLGHGDHVAHMDVPCAGGNLHRAVLSNVHLTDPHMVGVRVALHRCDAAYDDIGDLRAQVLSDLHFGPGKGHGLGEVPVP